MANATNFAVIYTLSGSQNANDLELVRADLRRDARESFFQAEEIADRLRNESAKRSANDVQDEPKPSR